MLPLCSGGVLITHSLGEEWPLRRLAVLRVWGLGPSENCMGAEDPPEEHALCWVLWAHVWYRAKLAGELSSLAAHVVQGLVWVIWEARQGIRFPGN